MDGRFGIETTRREERSSWLEETAPPPGVRLPRQPRSRLSFERMITAAHDLIAEYHLISPLLIAIFLLKPVQALIETSPDLVEVCTDIKRLFLSCCMSLWQIVEVFTVDSERRHL